MRARVLATAVALAALAVPLAGCNEDEPKAAAPPAKSSAKTTPTAPPSAPPTGTAGGLAGRKRAPEPTDAQARAYLAALARIDPGLVVNRDRALRRAHGVCDRIINPPGGNITLERYTAYMLSGGHATINETQARQVIRAVRVWCR